MVARNPRFVRTWRMSILCARVPSDACSDGCSPRAGSSGCCSPSPALRGCCRLGRWQLSRGEATHSLQNYAYAVEWALFAAFTLFCFYRFIRDAVRDERELTDAPALVELPCSPPARVSQRPTRPTPSSRRTTPISPGSTKTRVKDVTPDPLPGDGLGRGRAARGPGAHRHAAEVPRRPPGVVHRGRRRSRVSVTSSTWPRPCSSPWLDVAAGRSPGSSCSPPALSRSCRS